MQNAKIIACLSELMIQFSVALLGNVLKAVKYHHLGYASLSEYSNWRDPIHHVSQNAYLGTILLQ